MSRRENYDWRQLPNDSGCHGDDEERKARLEKMVATTLLRLALEMEEERRARLEHLSDNPIYIQYILTYPNPSVQANPICCSDNWICGMLRNN